MILSDSSTLNLHITGRGHYDVCYKSSKNIFSQKVCVSLRKDRCFYYNNSIMSLQGVLKILSFGHVPLFKVANSITKSHLGAVI